MTCSVCGDCVSWQRMEKIVGHVHLVLASTMLGDTPPCGIAINADAPGKEETFLCLRCAASVGRAAQKALKALGVSA